MIADRSGLFQSLNEQQRTAVECTEGPLLVLAGAGTGKTKVITTRIAYLLRKGIPPKQILAVTFTRKAAEEMRTRVEDILGFRPWGLTISTFHSLGFFILRDLTEGQVHVIDEASQRAMVKRLGQRYDLDLEVDRVCSQISRAKNFRISPNQVRERARTPEEHAFARCYAAYQAELEATTTIDFDDMISMPLEFLARSRAASERYRRRWRYILVDEYQDTNQIQYELMRCLLGVQSNICVVGDDDQSIYGFRGASADRILSFKDDFPNTTTVALEMNYRSHAEIIALANSIISSAPKRYPKRLVSSLGPGGAIAWKRLEHERAEAGYIIEQIRSLTRTGRYSLRDIAVIARVASSTETLQQTFRSGLLPFAIGKSSPPRSAVTIMTLHQAKGLEFPVVFVPAIEEDSIPHFYALKEGPTAVEEERRLFYVAVTRAKKQLILTACASRKERPREVSRFLTDLPKRSSVPAWRELSRFFPFLGKV